MKTSELSQLTPLPDADKARAMIKKDFEERYKQLLGDRYEEFMNYSLSYLNKSIRANLSSKTQVTMW